MSTKSLVRCKVACLNTRSTPNPCSGYILKQQHCYLLTLEDWNETVENADIDTANGIPTGKLTPSIKIQSNPKLLPSCRETCLTLFLSLNLLNLQEKNMLHALPTKNNLTLENAQEECQLHIFDRLQCRCSLELCKSHNQITSYF